jgi:hypothetical protein
LLLPIDAGLPENLAAARAFVAAHNLTWPIIAKPDKGCVGFGVRRVHSLDELQALLEKSPVDYMLQKLATHPEEFGVFFSKMPGELCGQVIGLTHKQIPVVIGNGRDTIRTLVQQDDRFDTNRHAILKHARELDRVPARDEQVALLVQASHTYGAWFRDITDQTTAALSDWLNQFMASDPQVCHGRLDVRAASLEALLQGEGIEVIEFNGCLSEPIHIYDDAHSFRFGMTEFYRTYRRAYQAAHANRSRLRVHPLQMWRAYRQFYRNKRVVMETIG